jgi:hypothetical protein
MTTIDIMVGDDDCTSRKCDKSISLKVSSYARHELYHLGLRYAKSNRQQPSYYSLSPPIIEHVDLSSANTDHYCSDGSDDNTVMSIMTPDIASGSGIDHYLLLARTSKKLEMRSHNSNNNYDVHHVLDNDDGTSHASFNSPAPLLQAASYDSPNDEELEQQGMLNLLSSFNMEDIQNMTHSKDGGLLSNERLTWNKRLIRLVLNIFLSLITLLAMLIFWFYILGWHNTALQNVDTASLHAMQLKYCSSKFAEIISTFISALKQIHTLTRKIRWYYIKLVYTSWRDDFDLLSCLIRLMFRLQFMHQAISYHIIYLQQKLWTVPETFVVVWNTTFSVVSTHLQYFTTIVNSTSYPFMAQDLHLIKSVTPLVLLWPSVTYHSLTFENDTSKMLIVAPNKTANKSTRFWRESIRQPFIRHHLSLRRHRCIHNIPSIRTLLEDDILIQTSPPLNETNVHGQSQPIIFRGCYRLSLKNTHLNSILISSDIHENVAASLIMQRTRPPTYYVSLTTWQPNKAITGVKRNYYDSWLRTSTLSDKTWSVSSVKQDVTVIEKNVFDDVDAMKLLQEFVGNILHRRTSSQN